MSASPPGAGAPPGLTRFTWTIAVLTVLYVGLHVIVVRPVVFPAGAGLTLTGSPIAGPLADPTALRAARPPDIAARGPVVVDQVFPGGPADGAGIQVGDRVMRVRDASGQTLDFTSLDTAPATDALARWRSAWWLDVRRPFSVTVERDAQARDVFLTPRWFPDVSAGARADWLRRHLGTLAQMVLSLAGGLVLVALRLRGKAAALMTLTMFVNVAAGGALVGGEAWLPPGLREALVLYGWLVVPMGFPIVGAMVLHFPTTSAIVRRWPWLLYALLVVPLPVLVPNALSAAYLLGADAVAPALAWWSARPWAWSTAFVAAEAVNVAILLEGVHRYLHNPDPNERRRIQVVVYTGVPAALAWAVAEGTPILTALATGQPRQLPWEVASVLAVLMLVPAFSLPYAVAVKRVFSPRTVLRRSLQYALARRTLTVLAALPALPLVLSLVRQRDMSLAAIVTGRPLFYVFGIALLVVARRYREHAARWLDRRFFRAEYDAREILVSLAGRMPFETDPADLVSLVIHHVDSALHPETVAVLAEVEPGRLDGIGGRPTAPPPLPSTSGLMTLLRWSRAPLEVFLDDERSTAARLPADDRAWLEATGVKLLVPLLAGSAETPTLIGCLALGPKQSEEPYAADDRELIGAIAAQMAASLDLSRVRQRAAHLSAAPDAAVGVPGATTMGAGAVLGVCPLCQRCVDLARVTCPDDGTALVAVPGLPPVVDGKYRVDALVGRGGMGAVFRARDVRLDRDVAIKVVRADMLTSPDARVRFRREAQLVARLQHPAVVSVFDYGTGPDGAAYIVMEFVRGEDLRQRLRRQRVLEAREVVALVAGIAEGVQAAHDSGVLHRDLKPENVLLAENGAGPKVLDFGVAKQAPGVGDPAGTATAGATVVGTPAYMAPEQLRGQAVDGRADVFSLGVMTFEMLTGLLPFGAGSFVDVGVAHAQGRMAAGLPDALRDVIDSALAADPHGRPASPAAFATRLRDAAAHLPGD